MREKSFCIKHPDKIGHNKNKCKSCVSEEFRERNPHYDRNWRRAKKKIYQDYVFKLKEETPCKDCKKLYPHYVMDFDHMDRNDKRMDISLCVQRLVKWDFLLEEIAKCELVCSNCHRVRTYKRGHWYPLIEREIE